MAEADANKMTRHVDERLAPAGFYTALTHIRIDGPGSDSLRRRAMAHLRSIAARLDSAAAGTAARHGIHVSDLYVLMVLYNCGADHVAKVAVLQRALGFTSGGMTRRLDSMIEKGLVLRLPDPHDGRCWRAQLTDEGVALAGRIYESSQVRMGLQGAELSSDEWRQLGDLLARLDEGTAEPSEPLSRVRCPKPLHPGA